MGGNGGAGVGTVAGAVAIAAARVHTSGGGHSAGELGAGAGGEQMDAAADERDWFSVWLGVVSAALRHWG